MHWFKAIAAPLDEFHREGERASFGLRQREMGKLLEMMKTASREQEVSNLMLECCAARSIARACRNTLPETVSAFLARRAASLYR